MARVSRKISVDGLNLCSVSKSIRLPTIAGVVIIEMYLASK